MIKEDNIIKRKDGELGVIEIEELGFKSSVSCEKGGSMGFQAEQIVGNEQHARLRRVVAKEVDKRKEARGKNRITSIESLEKG